MPGGLLVTVPLPVPCLLTVKVGRCTPDPSPKRAVQVLSALMVIVPVLQAGSPVQALKV